MSRVDSKVVPLSAARCNCRDCKLHTLCIGSALEGKELEQLNGIVRRPRSLSRSDQLYRVGERFRALYVVRSGSLKTFTVADDGREQVTGFHLPGELVGLDAIFSASHPSVAQALETTSVCEMPFDRLADLGGSIAGLQRQLIRAMSREIRNDEDHVMALGKMSAEERLAALLLNFAGRFRERGYSAREFHLRMSRHDIGNYLGLAMETVSRLFSRFQDLGLIEVERKFVRILDADALARFAHDTGTGYNRQVGM